MNGTSVMTALACLAYARCEYLMRLCTRITALVSVAMEGNAFHFDERLFAAKPHPGQQQIAAWLRANLQSGELPHHSNRLQDRYSLRCAPTSSAWWPTACPGGARLSKTSSTAPTTTPSSTVTGSM